MKLFNWRSRNFPFKTASYILRYVESSKKCVEYTVLYCVIYLFIIYKCDQRFKIVSFYQLPSILIAFRENLRSLILFVFHLTLNSFWMFLTFNAYCVWLNNFMPWRVDLSTKCIGTFSSVLYCCFHLRVLFYLHVYFILYKSSNEELQFTVWLRNSIAVINVGYPL